MNDGEISARHYATRKPVRLRWREGRIMALDEVEEVPRDLWLAPPLVDLQVNGYGGVDFQQDSLTREQLLSAAEQLRRDGCMRFFPTLITDEWPRMTTRLRHLKTLRDSVPQLQQAIVGWHVEGPFLSTEPGFCGAHTASVMCDPTLEHIEELRSITGRDPVLLTLAPERNGALAAIAEAVLFGVKVSLGHTNASAEILQKAVIAGAVGFTHLGNACPQQLDRHDNILWRVFDTPGLKVSLIADGIHVSPALFRTAHRVLGPDAIYYTTDAMAAAGAGPGCYTIGKLTVEVGADQIVRQAGQTNFAGSALRPIDGVFRVMEMLKCPWQEAWMRFSSAPVEFMGLPRDFEIGRPANFCLLTVSEKNQILDWQLYLDGLHN